jgi:transcriptional regulator with XRE-family HTH domain
VIRQPNDDLGKRPPKACRRGVEVSRNDDHDGTPQGVFGSELRYYREQAGLSQTELAALVNCSHDVISKIETGDRPPAKDFPERLDAVPQLDTRGALSRLWKKLRKGFRNRAIPGWFRPWAEVEAEASTLRSYEPLLVAGLLQTEEYARAILTVRPGISEDEVEAQVAARMERQAIVERADAPQFWYVLDEAVLHRCIGGKKVMHDQLGHLADLAELPKVSIQVVPASAGAHAGLLGAFVIADIEGAASMVYLETSAEGQVTDSPATVAHVTYRFDSLRSEALPRPASRDLIMKIAEEKWT